MSRYKGRTSFNSFERDFPYIVPLGGFGKKLEGGAIEGMAQD
jgi:hypothetical protein